MPNSRRRPKAAHKQRSRRRAAQLAARADPQPPPNNLWAHPAPHDLVYYNDEAQQALTERGWKSWRGPGEGDAWEWPHSDPAHIGSIPTSITCTKEGFNVEYASLDDRVGHFQREDFADLPGLMRAIERIEAHRAPQPTLPHKESRHPGR